MGVYKTKDGLLIDIPDEGSQPSDQVDATKGPPSTSPPPPTVELKAPKYIWEGFLTDRDTTRKPTMGEVGKVLAGAGIQAASGAKNLGALGVSIGGPEGAGLGALLGGVGGGVQGLMTPIQEAAPAAGSAAVDILASKGTGMMARMAAKTLIGAGADMKGNDQTIIPALARGAAYGIGETVPQAILSRIPGVNKLLAQRGAQAASQEVDQQVEQQLGKEVPLNKQSFQPGPQGQMQPVNQTGSLEAITNRLINRAKSLMPAAYSVLGDVKDKSAAARAADILTDTSKRRAYVNMAQFQDPNKPDELTPIVSTYIRDTLKRATTVGENGLTIDTVKANKILSSKQMQEIVADLPQPLREAIGQVKSTINRLPDTTKLPHNIIDVIASPITLRGYATSYGPAGVIGASIGRIASGLKGQPLLNLGMPPGSNQLAGAGLRQLISDKLANAYNEGNQ